MTECVIIDGSSLAFRAFYQASAMMPNATEEKINQTAMQIFGNFLTIARENKPKYAVIAWDATSGKDTFRGQLDKNYKGNRASNEVGPLFELLNYLSSAYGFKSAMMEGYEADDVIGTFTRQNDLIGIKSTVITADKDMLQLVSDNTTVFRTIRGMRVHKDYTPAVFKEEFGFNPAHFVDYKALIGDNSDNYKGVPGIGPKIATNLIKEYGEISSIYDNLDELKPGTKNKLVEGKDSGDLAYKLATIKTDIAQISIDDYKLGNVDNEKIDEITHFAYM